MWMDHRAADETAAINATRDPALAYVGGEVSIEMELPKVLWLRRHFPDRYAAARAFSTSPTTSSGAVAAPTPPASAR